MNKPISYIQPLYDAFAQHQNTNDARAMKAYLRNKFDFWGLKSPIRRELTLQHFQKYGLPDIKDVNTIVEDCWQQPQRECQYSALDLMEKVCKKLPVEAITTMQYMIVTKSWWDTVDLTATKLCGTQFTRFPHLIEQYAEAWAHSDYFWLNRTALLFQLKYKNRTDLQRLERYILLHKHSSEFFIQKAIGWVLREYSKTDARWVIDFVKNNELSRLSRTEALKWVEKQG